MKRTKYRRHDQDGATLAAIASELDGHEWDADTCERVAAHLRAAGYELRDVTDDDEDPRARGDDDGQEYADPTDELNRRLEED